MDVAPIASKSVAFKTAEIKIGVAVPLEYGYFIIASFQKKVDGFAAKLKKRQIRFISRPCLTTKTRQEWIFNQAFIPI